MRSPRGTRYSVEQAGEDMSSLSAALAHVQRLTGTNKIAMARKIGFAIGAQIASENTPTKYTDIHSELSSLFRKLNLGKVILRQWDPVVFVTCPGSRAESLQAAFGEGVLEGVVHSRLREPVFVKHSIPREKAQGPIRFASRRRRRRVKKT